MPQPGTQQPRWFAAGLLLSALAVPVGAETVALSGTVTDGSGAGWPLYARITIAGPGAPGPVFTNPADGTYGPVTLPGSGPYTLTVESRIAGYQVQTRTIDSSGPATEDFALPVDEAACMALGYAMTPTVRLSESFFGGIPPTWTVVDQTVTCALGPPAWSTADLWPIYPDATTIVTPPFAIMSAAACSYSPRPDIKTDLITPPLDFSDLDANDHVTVSFNSDYRDLCTAPGEAVTLEIGTFESGSWTGLETLHDFCGLSRRSRFESFSTQAGNGLTDVRFRFHYDAGSDWWWAVDDVWVTQTVCTHQGGGLIWGLISDAGSGGPVVGATVSGAAGSTLSIATPEDPNLADGYYVLASDAGSRTVTAAAPFFIPSSDTVSLASGELVRLDLSLNDASFGFAPYPVRVRIPLATATALEAEVSNSGPGAGDYSFVETAPWLTVSPASGVVQAATANPLTLAFDANLAAPGDHSTNLVLETDTNIGEAIIPVHFTVAFLDVAAGDPFDRFIHAIAGAGLTSGCGAGNFCPGAGVTRAQMAVWLLLGKLGAGYDPPTATGLIFDDVPAGSFAADFIERLSALGVTAGCGGGNFCPNEAVTRGQMAVFLLRSLEEASYTPPPATGLFDDVPVTDPFAPWIEELFEREITSGCSTVPRLYCPGLTLTRGQMAVFLATTFDVPTR